MFESVYSTITCPISITHKNFIEHPCNLGYLYYLYSFLQVITAKFKN